MKNIIVCSDGTGNSGGKGNSTNVWRVFEAISRDNNEITQVAFYDDGVGTENFKPVRIFSGAFGYGLSRNVKQLYTEICRIYEPGDRLYFFGFSRGAFTVRTLLGWIMNVGIIDPSHTSNSNELKSLVDTSYKILRSQFKTIPQSIISLDPEGEKSRKKLKEKLYKLNREQRKRLGHFIGIWDTVDAVGFPVAFISRLWNSLIYRFKFPNHKLDSDVKNAYQALAIDDERHTFHPQPFDEESVSEDQNLHQVWFSGMHSNVGGGYPQDGMAYVSLAWIMSGAKENGLRFTESLETLYRERANPMEKMYNSRSGFGIYYRFSPRNLSKIAHKYNLRKIVLHESVIERAIQQPGGYTPRHINRDVSIWSEENPQTKTDQFKDAFTKELESRSISDISKLSFLWDKLRQVVQWIVVGSTLLFMVAATMNDYLNNYDWGKWLSSLLVDFKSSADWSVLIVQIGVLLVLSFVLGIIAEDRASYLRSGFWNTVLKRLKSKKLGTHTISK